MTPEEFHKKRFSSHEEIWFQLDEESPIVECILIAVDFEQCLFKLIPIDVLSEIHHLEDNKSFWCRVEYCRRPIPKLRVVKKKKIKQEV